MVTYKLRRFFKVFFLGAGNLKHICNVFHQKFFTCWRRKWGSLLVGYAINFRLWRHEGAPVFFIMMFCCKTQTEQLERSFFSFPSDDKTRTEWTIRIADSESQLWASCLLGIWIFFCACRMIDAYCRQWFCSEAPKHPFERLHSSMYMVDKFMIILKYFLLWNSAA